MESFKLDRRGSERGDIFRRDSAAVSTGSDELRASECNWGAMDTDVCGIDMLSCSVCNCALVAGYKDGTSVMRKGKIGSVCECACEVCLCAR